MMATARASKGQVIGYQRVSSEGQNESRQLDGIIVDRMFTDKVSGKDVNRPHLQAALSHVREGDVFIVHSMDRLARNMTDLRNLVSKLTDKGVEVRFLKEQQTFTGDKNPMANLLLGLLGAVAEFERELILERQREGIAQAKREGKYKGRKAKLTAVQVAELRKRIAEGANKAALAREFGVTRQTLYTAVAAA